MRFAGCCNISCKRIDAVEHSDDLGASRKGRNLPTSEKQSTLEKIASPLRRGSKKIQQSNAPGPKDLDALLHVPRGFRTSRNLREKNVIRRVCRCSSL